MAMDSNKKLILVVDDEADILVSIQIMLEDAAYTVMTTEYGEDVDRLQQSNRPNLILLDMLLGDIDGREIIQQMKGREETKYIPIILLSAHPTGETEAIVYGADDFLAKPFEMDELLTKVAQYV
jgi:DNA-binding response OmpR family regulator